VGEKGKTTLLPSSLGLGGGNNSKNKAGWDLWDWLGVLFRKVLLGLSGIFKARKGGSVKQSESRNKETKQASWESLQHSKVRWSE